MSNQTSCPVCNGTGKIQKPVSPYNHAPGVIPCPNGCPASTPDHLEELVQTLFPHTHKPK